ncbi:unnamed protein product [Heterobilharzia americana]|nr:unnamed protein product [Heterobilharzia americana]
MGSIISKILFNFLLNEIRFLYGYRHQNSLLTDVAELKHSGGKMSWNMIKTKRCLIPENRTRSQPWKPVLHIKCQKVILDFQQNQDMTIMLMITS